MNRSEFVAAVAERGGMSQAEADRALNAIFDEIEAAVKKGEKLTIPGWVTVSTAPRAARTGRNPQTGAPVEIKATTVVKLAAGSKLKAAAKS
ncbi:MAG: HU family DNA-binding protein [Acidimicrobiales bacterium]